MIFDITNTLKPTPRLSFISKKLMEIIPIITKPALFLRLQMVVGTNYAKPPQNNY